MAHNASGRMTTGQRIDDIKASIPGTKEYEARHGYDKAHANVQNLKAHLPGTSAHHERYAPGTTPVTGSTGMAAAGAMPASGTTSAYTDTGMGAGLTGSGYSQPTASERVMGAIPGTEEHREKKTMGGNMGSTGTGNFAGSGHSPVGTGKQHYSTAATGGTSGGEYTTGGGATGGGYITGRAHGGTAGMTTGERVKAAVPGTKENRDKQLMQADQGYSSVSGVGYTNLSPRRRHSATGAGHTPADGLSGPGYMGGVAGTSAAGLSGGHRVPGAVNQEKRVTYADTDNNDILPGNTRDQGYPRSSTAYNDATMGNRYQDQGYATTAGTADAHEEGQHKSMGTKLKELLPCTQEHKLHKVDQQAHNTY